MYCTLYFVVHTTVIALLLTLCLSKLYVTVQPPLTYTSIQWAPKKKFGTNLNRPFRLTSETWDTTLSMGHQERDKPLYSLQCYLIFGRGGLKLIGTLFVGNCFMHRSHVFTFLLYACGFIGLSESSS